MNKYISIMLLALIFAATSSHGEETNTVDKDIAYFFGYHFANSLKEGGNEKIDVDTMLKGFNDSLGGVVPDLNEERQQAVIAEVKRRHTEVQNQRIAGLAEAAKSFMAYNGNQEGIKTTASGLQYQVMETGTGPSPTAADQVKVHYTGRLINDQVFDSSVEAGQPVTFGLNQVIPGWTEGLQLMKAGGKTRFFVPPELGYGATPPRNIPPNAVLIFDVELIEVNPKPATAKDAAAKGGE